MSEGWMLDLFVAGSWIPSSLDEVCRGRQYSKTRELGRLLIMGGNIEEKVWQLSVDQWR